MLQHFSRDQSGEVALDSLNGILAKTADMPAAQLFPRKTDLATKGRVGIQHETACIQ